MTDTITSALDRINRDMDVLATKAKRINYTLPVEPDRKLTGVQDVVTELKKAARISHGARPQ